MKMQNFFMHCRFQQWRPQFDNWYIFCFRIESFPNNSKNIIACLYIHISLCYSLTYYINVLSVASSHFLSLLSKVWYHRTDNYAYFCVINGNPASVGGITKWFKILVACNGASEIFFSQAYNRLQHLVRFSPYLLFFRILLNM